MNFSLLVKLILLVTFVIDGVLLFIILFKKNKKAIHYLLFFCILGILGWVVSVYILLLTANFFVAKLTFFFALFFLFFLFWFTLVFPSHKFPKINLPIIVLLVVTIFEFFVLFLDGSLFHSINIIDDYYIKVDTGYLSLLYTLLTSIYILSPLVMLIKKSKNKKYGIIIGKQIKFLLAGYSLFIFVIWFSNYLLPIYFKIYFFNGIGPSFSLVFVGFVLFIISRYSFLDIKLIIQRSLVYSLVFSFVIGIYLFLIFVAGLFFSQSADLASITIALITTIISVYTVPMIERYFMRVTDYIFFKDKYDYSEALFDLSEVLNKNINLEALLKKIGVKLKEIFKIEQLLIILPERKIVLGVDGRISNKLNRHMEWYMRVIEGDNMLMINTSKEARLAKTADERKCEHESYKITLSNGKKFHVAMTVPIRLDNKLIGILAMGDKISGDMYTTEDCSLLKTFSYQAAVALEKSQLYEKAKNYSVELEKEVRERTGKIQSLQEEQKLMMLEIAHGMQTPLTIIKGEMRNLEEQVEDKKNIEVLENTIDRISKFIYDMLKLARMENQGSNFKKEKFDLSELLFELVESFEIICNDKDIKIEQDIASGIYMLGDQGEIAELITNLASNSIKYMDSQREKVIKLELKKDTGKIKLALADTGVGIDKDGLKKIFNRFYRVNDDDHAGKSGTGLGLAICKEIVEHHNGMIEVQSEKGKGTETTIYFPEVRGW